MLGCACYLAAGLMHDTTYACLCVLLDNPYVEGAYRGSMADPRVTL